MPMNPLTTVIRFNDLINAQDVNALAELMSENHRFIDSAGNVTTGREKMRAAWKGFFSAFPDYRNVFESTSVIGNRVIVTGRSECSDERLAGRALWVAEILDGLVSLWQVFEDTTEERLHLGIRPAVADDLARVVQMKPELHDGVFVWCVVRDAIALAEMAPLVCVREDEGFTVVVPEEIAKRLGVEIVFRSAWITLTAASALDDVGLTAAFSRLLGDAGISCNVVAGVHHDHIFVPEARGQEALRILTGAAT